MGGKEGTVKGRQTRKEFFSRGTPGLADCKQEKYECGIWHQALSTSSPTSLSTTATRCSLRIDVFALHARTSCLFRFIRDTPGVHACLRRSGQCAQVRDKRARECTRACIRHVPLCVCNSRRYQKRRTRKRDEEKDVYTRGIISSAQSPSVQDDKSLSLSTTVQSSRVFYLSFRVAMKNRRGIAALVSRVQRP